MTLRRKFRGFSKKVIVPDLRRLRDEYENIFSDRKVAQLIGLDRRLPSPVRHRTIKIKAQGVPPNCLLPIVISGNCRPETVVKNLDYPQVQFREAKRVLKSGGLFI